ncbi:porin family protein [Pseudodesulfovibrio sediminis]|uniref:Uncharacterized protein n=1 Tax=Pseudodesulfovibrio sediminis TaxID=2810563 RepID=A0ABM7P6G2_9BACT|nr:porin family protein [Pseudodesulfovibrio sediminis]BCS89124.1 hypothetical protein PSDVSF_23660 [Pseudodesulfovibrio sediminis]
MQISTLRLLSVFSALVFLFVTGASAFAGKGEITPSIMVQSAYDDNVQYKGKSDWEFRSTPAVKLEYGQENWTLSGGGSADFFKYAELTDSDRENYKLWLGGERYLTERFLLNFESSFSYDHTFVDEYTESGSVTEQALRRKYMVMPGAMWNATEKDQLSLGLPLSTIRYAGKDNPDSTTRGGVVGWTHALNNELVSLIWQGSYTNYHYSRLDGDTNEDVYMVMGGLSYKPSELIDLKGLVGLGYADSKVSFDTLPDMTNEETFFSFDLSGTYSRERWKFTLGADRKVSPSIYGESSLRTRGRVSGDYAFTERFSLYCETAYYETETNGLISSDRDRTYYVRPWLKYRLSEDMTIRLEYKFTNTKDLRTQKEQQQNRMALRFEYAFPTDF